MAALRAAGGEAAVSNQLPYSPLWRQIERAILPECAAHGQSVLCYSSASAKSTWTGVILRA